jgi:hypothetical protein
MRKTGVFKLKNVGVRGILGLVLLAVLAWGTGCKLSSGANTVQTGPTPTPTPSAAHSVDITWNTSPSTNVQGYKVYRSQISGGPYSSVSGTLATSTLAFTDGSVLGGQTYFYVLTSIDVNGLESPPSVEVSATIPTP